MMTGSCGSADVPADPAADAQAARARQAFDTAQLAWRAKRQQGLLAPDGWTTLTGLHWLEYRAHSIGSSPESGIRLPQGPARVGLLTLERDGRLHFVPAAGAEVQVDGEPVQGRVALRSDADAEGPSRLHFDAGKGSAVVIKRGDRFALRTRHAEAHTRTAFAGLQYWPADPQWAIHARFVANPAGSTQEVATLINTVEHIANPGVLEFQHGGITHRLQALDDGSGELFVIFADRTNRDASYAAGRYVYVPMPDAGGGTVIDFNRAYNPPCVFTDYATCPLPPRDNRLDIAVTAGEKRYLRPDPHSIPPSAPIDEPAA